MSLSPELDNWYVYEQSIIRNIRKRRRNRNIKKQETNNDRI